MSTAAVLDHPGTVLRVGRQRTQHAPRVLIEGQSVVIRSRCGVDPLPNGFTETSGYVTCDACLTETPETDRG